MADMNIKRELPVHPLSKVFERRAKLHQTEVVDNEDDEPYDYSDEPTTFPCGMCSASFVTRVSLARHMILHEDETPKFPCCFCESSYLKKEDLAAHITNEHGGAKFSCQYCNRNLPRRDHLKRHIRNVHLKHLTNPEEIDFIMKSTPMPKIVPGIISPNSQYNNSAGSSNDSLDNEEDMINGESYHEHDIKPEIDPDHPETMLQITVDVEPGFQEDHDDYEMDNDQDQDQDSMLYQESLAAPPSPEDFDPITKINASLNGIRVDRKYQCDICGASFMTRINLQRHQTSHSMNRPHKCPICSKGFVRKEHLTKHLSSVHSGMKFTCEFCGKDISRKDHLIRHIRNVHPAEYLGLPPELAQSQLDLPISALQASGFAISDKALLSMQPKPKKPYLTCDMCDQTFTHINHLHEHQSTWHADVRRFKCNFCPKAFKRKEHLTKHEVLHTGEKNFGCNHCGKEFPRKDALQDHIRRIHGSDHIAGIEFPCNFCEKVFLQRPNLLRHMKNLHGLIVNLPPNEGGIMGNNSFAQGAFSNSMDDNNSIFGNSDSPMNTELALSLVGLSKNPAIQIDRVNF